eukprot:CAMPEP_0194035182 /NCGR_PEP_ID=MMETSP0009_2-20130614/7649_1 /TAXON_ID=210454 /ORGANISM="Grammatophora oceanica, Strain CCMP 410" /LENGTH=110 /DNA_ID=CAMNT_0038676447 /DNA_START=116 /DNA_END=448 /DNA_ORIENTATION=+
MTKDTFHWLENSKVMFDKVCESSPRLVRHFTRDALTKALKKHGCGDVTEAMMYIVVKEVTPAKYLARTLKILDENRTVFPPSSSSKEEEEQNGTECDSVSLEAQEMNGRE